MDTLEPIVKEPFVIRFVYKLFCPAVLVVSGCKLLLYKLELKVFVPVNWLLLLWTNANVVYDWPVNVV